ncbi:hypothetical protein GQN02_24255, partial [Escherichia coli]|uniref:hypothetical protein n=1 Tax=Escherichia coli TaxID=562 RepID=UPI00132334A6
MAPNSALLVLLMGAALGISSTRVRIGRIVAEALATTVVAGALAALIGYLYGGQGLYRIGTFIPMALPTAAALLILGVGIIASRADHAFCRILSAPGTAG